MYISFSFLCIYIIYAKIAHVIDVFKLPESNSLKEAHRTEISVQQLTTTKNNEGRIIIINPCASHIIRWYAGAFVDSRQARWSPASGERAIDRTLPNRHRRRQMSHPNHLISPVTTNVASGR